MSWKKLWQEHPELEGLVVMPALGANSVLAGSRHLKVKPLISKAPRCSRPRDLLKRKLATHGRWLDASGRKGKQLVLGNNAHTDFRGCRLSQASSKKAYLVFSRFDGVHLDGAELHDADCSMSSFQGADLRGTDLSKSLLYGVDFRKADLRDANLDGAWALGTNFGGADLQGASVRDTVFCHYGLRDQMMVYLATLGLYTVVRYSRRITTIISLSQLRSTKAGPGTIFPVGMAPSGNRYHRNRTSWTILNYV